MQLAGELSNFSLTNLIQLIRGGHLRGKMSLSHEGGAGLICFDDGAIVHAQNASEEGREALMKLFLWQNGSFSFQEDELTDVPRSVDTSLPENSIEILLREGADYAEQSAFLRKLNIAGESIFKGKPISSDEDPALDAGMQKLLQYLDGQTSLNLACQKAELWGRPAVSALYKLITQGLAEIVNEAAPTAAEAIHLPDWVKARLRQDNRDLSKAIIDMVIWVDRVKCWMFQADADMNEVLKDLSACEE